MLAAPAAHAEPTGEVTRSFNQRMNTKVRAGSALGGERGPPVAPAPDLAGPLEVALESEVGHHGARMAEFDVIAEVVGQGPGAERVEEVRRREVQRYFAALRRLRLARWQAWLAS